ncbi:MAG: hypothetical protein KGO22_03915 [Gammaproteobacteria bacterium]|nr:hypothetical protein [Gammaproteobacteria bacterium]
MSSRAAMLLCVLTLTLPLTSRAARAPVPPFECRAYVAYDLDQKLPGYVLPTGAGARTCIPFTSVAEHPPKGYRGDFYVDEFTDAQLRKRWEACKSDAACRERIEQQVSKRRPPNREHFLQDPHGRHLLGKIDEKGALTDLRTIRRPGFFARPPYHEPIAAADADTYIVEFTAPRDPYERLHMHMTGTVQIRGWYIRGAGIGDGKGGHVRALIIANGGGGDRIAAIDDPHDVAYVIDPKSGQTIPDDSWPNATTGAQGMRHWRELWFRLHQAGFDVLAMDRRGVGISGGYDDEDTLQQGRDILDIVATLRSGRGMRALGPSGRLAGGSDAAVMVRGGPSVGMPVFLLGSSRGTMASGWAMTINFAQDCSYDLPAIRCLPPHRDPTVKGAILVADFSSGIGYLEAQTSSKNDGRGAGRDRALFMGAMEEQDSIVFFPSSAILAGIHDWPSAFFARGLWCYADGLEGEMDSYARVRGLKDLFVVRGPHAFATWPAVEELHATQHMIAYARAVVLGEKSIPGRRRWSDMKQLVGTSDDVWEASTHPTLVH